MHNLFERMNWFVLQNFPIENDICYDNYPIVHLNLNHVLDGFSVLFLIIFKPISMLVVGMLDRR